MQQFEFTEDEILYISAKEGKNVDDVFQQVIERIKPPNEDAKDNSNKPMKAFLFDARFVPNRGVACLIKIM